MAVTRFTVALPTGSDYLPRRPEQTVLYEVVASHLETFLALQRRHGHGPPRFVEREFRAFLQCGIPAHGFVRLHCASCGQDKLLPFSCKRRGFCPSCCGRRMADTAAHLVDRVLPPVAVRQWVLSMPYGVRYRLGYDSALLTRVFQVFSRAVFGFLKRRARECGILGGQCGAITFIQRFGGSLNLFHMLALDGVYAPRPNGEPEFFPLHAPEDADVRNLVVTVAGRIRALLKGESAEDCEDSDALVRTDPGHAGLLAASISGRTASGPRAGQKRFGKATPLMRRPCRKAHPAVPPRMASACMPTLRFRRATGSGWNGSAVMRHGHL